MSDRFPAFPMLKVTLESMSLSIMHAFHDQQLAMDAQLQDAVKKFCTPENIRSIINKQVQESIDHAIKQEVGTYFSYGDGRKTIHEAVIARLQRDYA